MGNIFLSRDTYEYVAHCEQTNSVSLFTNTFYKLKEVC